jgi:hypothetical protein
MTEVSKMPERLRKALAEGGQEIAVLRPTQRWAQEDFIADSRALIPDFAGLFHVYVSHDQIRFANGSRITYIGGDEERLERWSRGRIIHFIDRRRQS